ncbi:hypothetical protein [Deinococcus sonorensis]|uniref:Uncharacterized protein n=2 Tax=Deinococcus sonorensis TaxID=309891 RepID=A0AAU7UEU3_9DEIO
MNDITTFINAAWPHFVQLDFWITVAITILVWYGLAVGLAHLLAGAGGREALQAARQSMPLALLLVMVGLLISEYFLFNPNNFPYLVAVAVATLLLTLLVLTVFGRLGKDN